MNSKSITITVFLVLIVGSICGFLYYKKYYFPKYSWSVDYRKTSEQPYGLKFFYETIKKQSSKLTTVKNQAYYQLDTNQTNSNMIYVGNEFSVDSADAQVLMKYVEKGNRVLISNPYCPIELLRNFVYVGDSIFDFENQVFNKVRVNFTGDSLPFPGELKFHFQVLKDTSTMYWNSYKKSSFNDTLAYYQFVPIALLNDSAVTTFYVPHGKGMIIMHSNPILFTNFYMAKENGFRHANNMLSLLNKGPVYWNEIRFDMSDFNNAHGEESRNPLKFLFSHPYLKWGWYLFLVTVILYLVFRSKREQRIIPLMPVNTNASVEYTKAIGTLYFQSKGVSHIGHEMFVIFLAEVRNRYNISTDIAEQELINELSVRSGIDKSMIYDLFRQFKYVRNDPEAASGNLIDLYNSIETYHKKRK